MVSIELGKRERNLRYDYNALCDLEEKAKVGIPKLMDEYAGFNTLRLLIWAGNKHENRGLTLDMVGLWIQEYLQDGGQLEDLYGKVTEELMNSGVLGKPNQEKKETKETKGKKGN
jgi:hypothetical protein